MAQQNPFEDDPDERRRGQLAALAPTPATQTDPYKEFQGGVEFATGPVSTTMPVSNPNTATTPPATVGTLPGGGLSAFDTTPAANTASTAGATGGGGLTGQRDQWSAPANVAARGDFGRTTGFSNDMGSQSLKNQARNIFSGFDPTLGVGQLFTDPEFTRLFPNARAVGDDKIDWGHGNAPLDVITNYGAPNAQWSWQSPEGEVPIGGAGAVGGGAAVPTPNTLTPTMGGQSNIDQVIAEVMAIANQTRSPAERDALIQLLLGGDQPEAARVI